MKTRAVGSVGSRAGRRRTCQLRLEGLECRTQPGSLLLSGVGLDLPGAASDLGALAADTNAVADPFAFLWSDGSADPLSPASLALAGVSAPVPAPTQATAPSSLGGPTQVAALSGAAESDAFPSASGSAPALPPAPGPVAASGGALAAVVAPPSLLTAAPAESTAAVGAGPNAAALTGGPRLAPTSPAGSSAFGGRPSQLPFSFEANQGQTDAHVQFLAHGAGYTLFLTPTAAVFSLPVPATAAAAGTSGAATGMVEALRMDLVGANPAAAVAGQDPLPGRVNYLLGNDAAHWHVHVPTFGRVAYQGVYPGVDLAYYGQQGQLEYDFIVHPGADPHLVRLGFEGADQVSLDGQGELVLATAAGPLVQPAPVVYQEINGVHREVAGHFVQAGPDQVGFTLGAYDPSQPLVIDPVVATYSTYLGGSGTDGIGGDLAYGVAVDSGDHAYVTGSTSSTDFPTTPGAFQTTLRSRNGNAFVTKLTADGSGLVYSTYLGGSLSSPPGDAGHRIAVDAAGHAYVTGQTRSPDFPTTPGAFQTTFHGNDGTNFVTELTPDGSGLVYSTYLGGSDSENGWGIAVDAAGHAYVTGDTSSSDFPTTPGAFQTTLGSIQGLDAFVTELTPDGSGLVYSTYLGGSRGDAGYGIAVDAAGHAYVTGDTSSSDFPITPGAFQRSLGARVYFNAFVTELTPDGSGLVYSTYLGGSNNMTQYTEDIGWGITVDTAGDAYVTGDTSSSNFPTTPGAFQTTLRDPNGTNAFVTKLTPDGSGLVYSSYLGGSGSGDYGDTARGIAVDAAGRAYVSRTANSSDFPTTPGALHTRGLGPFVTAFTPDGANLAYSTYVGGFGAGAGIALAADGSVYVTGSTSSPDFPTTPGAFRTTYPGGAVDGWVASGRLM